MQWFESTTARRSFGRATGMSAIALPGVWCAALVLLTLAGCGDEPVTGRPSPDGRPRTMHDAIRSGDISEVKTQLAISEVPLDLKGKDGPILLAQAIEAEQPAVVKLLVDEGVSPQCKDAEGKPLMFKAAMKSGDMVRAMLTNGAPVDLRDNVGQTALHMAVGESKQDAVEALIEAGIDVNAVDRSGLTALHSGINADLTVLDLLRKHGAKVDTTDVRGSTPLHKAAAAGNRKAIAWLLDAGANVNTKNTNGHTPLYLARPEVRDTLLKHGAKE